MQFLSYVSFILTVCAVQALPMAIVEREGIDAGVGVHDDNSLDANIHSPGVISGNVVNVPVSVPVNLCGDDVGGVGDIDPTVGHTCVAGDVEGSV